MLAREVLKYSDLEVPIEFGRNFVVRYEKGGAAQFQQRLKMDTSDFTPTGFAVLRNNEYLVVGYRQAQDKTFIIAESFRSDGSLADRSELSHEGTRTSNGTAVASSRVLHPVAIKANGLIYVLRGTTNEPVYVLSDTGQLRRTVQLKPEGLEFDSPKIAGNNLIVSAHSPFLKEPETGVQQRRDFPIFSLETGEIVLDYYWHEATLGLACYSPGSLTFIGQDLTTPDGWAIFEAEAAVSTDVKRLEATN